MGHGAHKKKRRSSRSQAAVAPAAAISTVLENDDLLGEVLLRVALPTSLVRAALVCRRWLRVAAGPAFLLRFHDRHPPPLLGLYVHSLRLRGFPKFEAMPSLPPELGAGARRAGSAFDAFAGATSLAYVLYCLDGHLLVRLGMPGRHRDVVVSPMRPAGRRSGPVVVPPPPLSASFYDHYTTWLKRRDGFPGRRGVVVCAAWRHRGDQTFGTYELRGGAWHERTSSSSSASPKTKLPDPTPNPLDRPYFFLHCGDEIYLISSAATIADLRSASPSSETPHLTLVALPDGVVKYELRHAHRLQAWTDSSVIYLIQVVDAERLQLRVWLYQLDSSETSWSLEDTLCLRTLLAGSGETTALFSDQDRRLGEEATDDVMIQAVGRCRGAMCVLLQVGADVLYINIKNRTVEKVYTVTPEDGDFVMLAPFSMIFPPVFPVIKDVSDQNQMRDPPRVCV